jgi:hypothetical protein
VARIFGPKIKEKETVKRQRQTGKPRCRYADNIKKHLKKIL